MREFSSSEIDKLAEALAEAQKTIKHASKAVSNEYFKSKYADLPAVIDAAREPLTANGLAVIQVTDFDDTGVMTLVTTLAHKSGQWIRSYYPVRPIKSDPQGIGSALTYARRYAYSALVGVAASEDDDDGNAASQGQQVEPEAKPVFKNAALRKSFCENVIDSFERAQSLAELDQLATLNAAKFKEMDAGSDHDKQGVDELRKRYSAAKTRILQPESNGVMEELDARMRAHEG